MAEKKWHERLEIRISLIGIILLVIIGGPGFINELQKLLPQPPTIPSTSPPPTSPPPTSPPPTSPPPTSPPPTSPPPTSPPPTSSPLTPTPGPTSTPTELIPPIAKIDAPSFGEPNKKIKFSGINSSDDNSIIAFDWSFGDGEYGSGMNVTHSYDLPNKYTVSLTVIDNDEIPNSAIKDIEIKIPSYSDSLPDLKWKNDSFRILPHSETNTYLVGDELQIYHTVESVNSQEQISFCVNLDIVNVDYDWTKHIPEQCVEGKTTPNYTFLFKDSLSVPGKYQLKFNLDYKDQVREENEKNNISSKNILIS